MRVFDVVRQLLLVPEAAHDSAPRAQQNVEALEHNCYPALLRLTQNSLGPAVVAVSLGEPQWEAMVARVATLLINDNR